MSSWNSIITEVGEWIARFSPNDLFFRGHSDSNWKLLPSLARRKASYTEENRLYNKFIYRGGHLFKNSNSWETLFLMQHHGIPTRLLDWSGSFSVALYFALKDWTPGSEAAVWILDPNGLNKTWYGKTVISRVEDDFPGQYHEYFTNAKYEDNLKFPCDVAAIFGSANHPRMRSQISYFTLHNDLEIPLENKYPDYLHKIIISDEHFKEARNHLFLSGINEHTLFPDLDGLSRQLIQEEFDNFGLYFNHSSRFFVAIRDFKPDSNIAKGIMRDLLHKGIEKTYFSPGLFNEDSAMNEAILIGRKVPLKKAKEIIRISLKHAPFLKYLRYYEDNINGVLIGGKSEIAIKNGAKMLTFDDFKKISRTRITNKAYHKLMDVYSYGDKNIPSNKANAVDAKSCAAD